MTSVSAAPEISGQPVLLLHCSASSGRQWDGLAGSLPEQFVPCAPDLYGYGSGPRWSGPGRIDLSAEARLAVEALPADAGKLHLVGHSYGGAVALRFAVEQPWRIRSLTLIEPVAFHTLREGGKAEKHLLDSIRRIAASVIRHTLTGDYHGAMQRFVDYWSGDGAWQLSSPSTRQRLGAQAPKVVLDFHAAISEQTPLETYRRRFDFPVRIVRGELSPAPTRRIAELLSERILGASLTTIPGAGHMLPLSHPEQVNAAILAQLDAGGRSGLRAA
ncbi:MAG TPA: alpha/beta hydrolase [Arenicellales bacterium]|nr:alpha/beta hydrolase [Arenicellales bacterium]